MQIEMNQVYVIVEWYAKPKSQISTDKLVEMVVPNFKKNF